MGSLGFWSLLAILFQTLIVVTISWLTLDCKLEPDATELHEITLMKILYLYDPVACGKVFFYNVTASIGHDRIYSSIVWPTKNYIASRFRTEIQVWLSLHLIWTLFAIINTTQGQRSCSFYATLLPFTITGIAILVTDVIYAILFLIDARYTYTESAILLYLTRNGHLRAIMKSPLTTALDVEDTSWIAVVMAYCSMRGIVQWMVNFWIVKDNYFEGLDHYRKLQYHKPRVRRKSSSFDL